MLVGDILRIDGDHVCDENLGWITVPLPRDSVLCDDVGGQLLLSPFTIAKAAACASLDRSVSDDPGALSAVAVKPPLALPEVEPGAFPSSRHRFLISRMSRSVV